VNSLNFKRTYNDTTSILAKISNLTNDQKLVFNKILEQITLQSTSETIDTFQLFLSGEGGTGKSHLIGVLDQQLTIEFANTNDAATNTPAVIIVAPTGTNLFLLLK
jgi:DNA replication protein DnaC